MVSLIRSRYHATVFDEIVYGAVFSPVLFLRGFWIGFSSVFKSEVLVWTGFTSVFRSEILVWTDFS